MHIHILGICGTFMGSLAQLAIAQGHRVTGCDANVYPPMSVQLERAGIELVEGYDPAQLNPAPDLVVIGNALSRGNPLVEYVLDKGLPYVSGPQWLGDTLLRERWVLAVAGTHGKTSTASMLAWILIHAGLQPGFLIGGVPENFGVSARLGESSFFVVEADEYDTAFFDKRAKFVHYHPRTLILNNLEYDHADIFPDLAAIQTQFHHLVRTVPQSGLLICAEEQNLQTVLQMGCWTPVQKFCIGDAGAAEWQAGLVAEDGSAFDVYYRGDWQTHVRWSATGRHNVANAVAAIAAAHHVGVRPVLAGEALCAFKGVKRRMEVLMACDRVTVYDDFAHHPTAIATTLQGLRKKVGKEKILAVIEPRSNTMAMGVHKNALADCTSAADEVFWFQPKQVSWSMEKILMQSPIPTKIAVDLEQLLAQVLMAIDGGHNHIVVMSNGGFGGFHSRLVSALEEQYD